MSKVNTIDRAAMKNVIRPAIEKKLEELSKELGIKLSTGNAQYGYTTGHMKIEMATISEDGIPMTPEREAFEQLHHLYDLPKEALDAVITMGGNEFRIAGIKTKARKNNVVLEPTDNSGRTAVAPSATVLAVYKLQHVHKKAS